MIHAKTAHFNGCGDEIELEFVEREATPRLLMKHSSQLCPTVLSLSNTVLFLDISVTNALEPPYTTEYTRSIYSPKTDANQITSRSTNS